MASRDRGGTRRTPVIGDGDGVPGLESSTEATPQASHLAHAYTRKQLQGLDPTAPVVPPQVASPETSASPPAELVSPGRARLAEPQEMGAIIGFQRSYDGGKTVYSYAAIKTPQGWHCTAVNFRPALTWVDLLAWIDAWPHEGDEQLAIWLAADWVELR